MNNKKKRIFDIIQIGYVGDVASRTFDIAITAAIIINLFIAIFDTFEQSIPYQPVLDVIEWITVIGFTIEYILRVWTAEYLYPNKCTGIARIKYIFSGSGIVDFLSLSACIFSGRSSCFPYVQGYKNPKDIPCQFIL